MSNRWDTMPIRHLQQELFNVLWTTSHKETIAQLIKARIKIIELEESIKYLKEQSNV